MTRTQLLNYAIKTHLTVCSDLIHDIYTSLANYLANAVQLCRYTFSDIVCCRDMDKLTFDFMILIKTAGREQCQEQCQAPLPLAACPMLAKINVGPYYIIMGADIKLTNSTPQHS